MQRGIVHIASHGQRVSKNRDVKCRCHDSQPRSRFMTPRIVVAEISPCRCFRVQVSPLYMRLCSSTAISWLLV